jgi:hypothetical protein
MGRRDPVPIFAQDHDPWSFLPVHDQLGGVTGELQTAPPDWTIALDLEAIGPVLEEPSAARQSQRSP